MKIDSDFDGGNILVEELGSEKASLRIRRDTASEFFQWFYFKVDVTDRSPKRFIIENAGEASFADGFKTFQACLSYDNETWKRTETEYKNGRLIVSVDPAAKTFWLASFQPYSWDRHKQLIAELTRDTRVRHTVLGDSLEGRPIDLIRIGQPAQNKKSVWITARQHPGEVMAEWWAEGFLRDLLSREFTGVLDQVVFYVVPNMNPDGAWHGNLRTNKAGVNLNRVWGISDTASSPEVHCVSTKMQETGADLVLDVHGEEMIPYCFLAGGHGSSSFSTTLSDLHDCFLTSYIESHSSMQSEFGYPIPEGNVDTTIQTYWVIETFNCPAFTLEMPFGQDATHPDQPEGWTAQSSMQLGAAAIPAIAKLIEQLPN